jgi:hypothetical protein
MLKRSCCMRAHAKWSGSDHLRLSRRCSDYLELKKPVMTCFSHLLVQVSTMHSRISPATSLRRVFLLKEFAAA